MEEDADTIIGNCDSSLFLGGKEPTTLKEISQGLGKETIDTYNTGEARGKRGIPQHKLSEAGEAANEQRRHCGQAHQHYQRQQAQQPITYLHVISAPFS